MRNILRRRAAAPLVRPARAVNIPTLVDDHAVLLAVVARPAAHGRGKGTKVTAAGSHAVAWRVASGTEAVGFLKLAVFGLRAIEHPARAAALMTEVIAVHATCPRLPTALPSLYVRKRLLSEARGFSELCRWDIRFSSRRLRACSPSIATYPFGFLPCSSCIVQSLGNAALVALAR